MSTERWLIVRKDGSLVLHEENDGWAFLRNGPQASEEPITAESLRRQYPILYEEYMQAMGISANKTLRISHSQWVSTVVPASSTSCTMVQSDIPFLGLPAISSAP